MLNSRNSTAALVLLMFALTGGPQAAAALKPQPFEAEFSLEARGFTVGETVWRVRYVDNGFVYEARTEATGIAAAFSDKRVVERSEWEPSGNELKPARYRYERSGRPDKSRSVDFDWDGGVVQNTRHGKTSRMSVPSDTVDRLGYMLVLMEDLRAGKRSFRYHIADGKNRMKVYELKVVGEGKLKTALGRLEVLKLIRDRDDEDRETTIWVAPSLDFIPVRIEHRENDDNLTITIRSFTRWPASAEASIDKTEGRDRLGPFR